MKLTFLQHSGVPPVRCLVQERQRKKRCTRHTETIVTFYIVYTLKFYLPYCLTCLCVFVCYGYVFVVVRCGCLPSLCAVVLCCECVLWMCLCGCVLWLPLFHASRVPPRERAPFLICFPSAPCAWCSLPDLNRQCTSTASSRWQCSPPDLSSRRYSPPDINARLPTATFPAGPQPPAPDGSVLRRTSTCRC